MNNNPVTQLINARRRGVPLVKLETSDPAAIIAAMRTEAQGKFPVLRWDISSGVIAAGKDALSMEAAQAVNKDSEGNPGDPAMLTANPMEALQRLLAKAPEGTMVFLINGTLFAQEEAGDNWKALGQAVWNCRDPFKGSKRTIVLVGAGNRLPSILRNDTIELSDPMPTREDIAEIVLKLHADAELPKPSDEEVAKSVECLAGIQSKFLCENIVAMAMSKDGLDYEFLWSQTIAAIERTAGLKVVRSGVKFGDIGGLEPIKDLLGRIIKGKRRPALVVLMDEVEKQMAGAQGDTSGVSQDALGQILTAMQDNDWSGILFPGFPGTGKTECGKAMGNEAGGLFLMFDFGGMKGQFVGMSEQMVRNAIAVLKARGGDKVFFIGTTNDVSGIPAPLFRRFNYGCHFFDLLSKQEQAPIWDIWMKKFNIEKQELPRAEGWTGAEIRTCCRMADEFSVPLVEAAKFVNPVAKAMGDGVLKLRKSASGKFFSANKQGIYYHDQPEQQATEDRKISLN